MPTIKNSWRSLYITYLKNMDIESLDNITNYHQQFITKKFFHTQLYEILGREHNIDFAKYCISNFYDQIDINYHIIYDMTLLESYIEFHEGHNDICKLFLTTFTNISETVLYKLLSFLIGRKNIELIYFILNLYPDIFITTQLFNESLYVNDIEFINEIAKLCSEELLICYDDLSRISNDGIEYIIYNDVYIDDINNFFNIISCSYRIKADTLLLVINKYNNIDIHYDNEKILKNILWTHGLYLTLNFFLENFNDFDIDEIYDYIKNNYISYNYIISLSENIEPLHILFKNNITIFNNRLDYYRLFDYYNTSK